MIPRSITHPPKREYTHPMDGEWVEQAAVLYSDRYPEPDRVMQIIRLAACIRERLPDPRRIDTNIPACMQPAFRALLLRSIGPLENGRFHDKAEVGDLLTDIAKALT